MIYNYVDTYSFKRSQKYMSMSKAIWGGTYYPGYYKPG